MRTQFEYRRYQNQLAKKLANADIRYLTDIQADEVQEIADDMCCSFEDAFNEWLDIQILKDEPDYE